MVLLRQLPWVMGYIAANSRKFFHPAASNEMLSVFVPLLNGTDLDVSSHLCPEQLLMVLDDFPAHSCSPILLAQFPPPVAPSNLLAHAIQNMGVN